MWLERNEDSPDETSRELNDRPEQHAPKAQEMEKENTLDETSRELKNGPEQHTPNAQAVDEKGGEPLSPEVIVEEVIPTTEPNGNKILTFAPTWLKKDSKFGSQFDVQIRAPDPPTVPQGDQTEDTRLRVETPFTPTHPPKILEEEEVPEKKNTSDEEKKHCNLCFLLKFPAEHEESDVEYHADNLEIVDPCHKGVSCDRCGEQDMLGIRWDCTTCQNYSLCADCEKFSCEYDVTFISNKGKRHEPDHNLASYDAPGEQKLVLKTDVVAKKKLCPRCLQETCTSKGGSAPCEDKDMEPFSWL